MRSIFAMVAACGVLVACNEPQALNGMPPESSELQTANKSLVTAQMDTGQTDQLPADVIVLSTTSQPVETENASISRSQDFRVVTQQETIASDAAKLAALKQKYTIIEPEALPHRKERGVNLAVYALSQKHPVGTKKFRRFGGSSGCSRYRNSPDAAQLEFLKLGGPAKDRKRLDGDGDGYACGWSPDKFRNLLQAIKATAAVSTDVKLQSTEN